MLFENLKPYVRKVRIADMEKEGLGHSISKVRITDELRRKEGSGKR